MNAAKNVRIISGTTSGDAEDQQDDDDQDPVEEPDSAMPRM